MGSEMDVVKMKVDDLRRELGARGLDTSGLKPALQKRLKEAISAETEAGKPTTAAGADAASAQTAPQVEKPSGTAEAGAGVASAGADLKTTDGGKDGSGEAGKDSAAAAADGTAAVADQPKTPEGNEVSATAAPDANAATEDEVEAARRRRAERFGISYEPRKVEENKKKMRAERFNIEPPKPAVSEEEQEKRRIRAMKFGLGGQTAKDTLDSEGLSSNSIKRRGSGLNPDKKRGRTDR
mmetsp:Transcript_10965/g.33639  ORF Transcript_10965/g.33639 Transcript_10965/m.33639 type:complete len:239 (+) Transcript_10965:84-800(+)